MSLVAELKRRNVFRASAAYLVSAWLLIEIADVLFPAFGFPRYALKLLISLLALGLLPIVVLAWTYELTPEGIVRDRGATGDPAFNAATGRRLDQVTIAMILLALTVVVTQRFVLPERVAPAAPVAASATPASPAPPAPAPARTAERRSVAVLPFANMSPDADNAYFADGITEELLNVLSRVDGLKVASRTSAFSFKDRHVPIREIADELGVAHVIEGSVRRQGARVRITAQLIDAHDDQHLWSQTYDRELDDIFAVQEEIANAIRDALAKTLGAAVGSVVEVGKPTANVEAYEAFLRGRVLFHQRGEGLGTAVEMLERAVELDPSFAEAWAFLAAAHATLPSYLPVDGKDEAARSVAAAGQARSLDDSLALPYSVLGLQAERSNRTLEASELYDGALAREPANSTALLWRGLLRLGVGHTAAAREDLAAAVALDPNSGINVGWYGAALGVAGDRTAGDAALAKAKDLGWAPATLIQASFALDDGDRVRASALRNAIVLRSGYPGARIEMAADTTGAALAAQLDAVPDAKLGDWPLVVAALGDPDAAIARYERASGDMDLLWWRLSWMPSLRPFVQDPRFFALAERAGRVAFWKKHGYPDGCRVVDEPAPHLDCGTRAP